MSSLKKYSMFGSFDLWGKWYVKNQGSDGVIDGILHHSAERIELELFGSFDEAGEKIDCIHGLSQDGNSLLVCG